MIRRILWVAIVTVIIGRLIGHWLNLLLWRAHNEELQKAVRDLRRQIDFYRELG